MRLPQQPTWAHTDTPLGVMFVVTSPCGVLRTAFSAPDGTAPVDANRLLAELTDELGITAQHAPGDLAALLRQVQEWFDGDRQDFDVPLDVTSARGFTRSVYEVIQEIPYGETSSYGEVAAMAGSPRAARAVGTVCRDVPISLFLPVHRVIRADGTTGESPSSPCIRRTLLRHERAVLGDGPSPWN